jgi:sugar lactone lactonase YvrE
LDFQLISDYIDSKVGEVWKFAFDPSTGNISDRKVFCTTPPDMDDIPTTGVFDGLCTDGSGNVWVARWKDRRVIGYNKDGEIIAMIRTPKAKSPTIPCFGGESNNARRKKQRAQAICSRIKHL